MKQRPILFNTEMVQSILAGRKTQTRRVVKPPKGVRYYFDDGKCVLEGEDDYIDMECPYGERGDILWVRETWCLSTPYGPEDYYYGYKAGDIGVKIKASERYNYRSADIYRPSIHMPKDAARIWLRIKDVRVERLQDISGSDCGSEGMQVTGLTLSSIEVHWDELKRQFKSLWQSINGEKSWNENPFVWVIEFERIEKP